MLRNFSSTDIKRADFFVRFNDFSTFYPPNSQPSLPLELDLILKAKYSSMISEFRPYGPTLFRGHSEFLLELVNTTISEIESLSSELGLKKNRSLQSDAFWHGVRTRIAALDSARVNENKTTIHTQYVCQVPRTKPVWSFIVSIVLADLVFLRACWTLYSWGVTLWLKKNNPTAMYCNGCVHQQTMEICDTALALQKTQNSSAAEEKRDAGKSCRISFARRASI